MVYIIDAADRIIHLDNDWAKCAAELGEPDLAPERILGRSLWSYVHGVETVHLYRLLVRRARRGAHIEFRLRFEAGGEAQLLRMRIQAVGGDNVIFEATPLPEAAAPADDKTEDPADGAPDAEGSSEGLTGERALLLVACSWCERLKMPDERWVEAEDAVAQMGLFERASLPQISHGVCADCYRSMGGGENRERDRISHRYVDLAAHSS